MRKLAAMALVGLMLGVSVPAFAENMDNNKTDAMATDSDTMQSQAPADMNAENGQAQDQTMANDTASENSTAAEGTTGDKY